MLTKAPRDEWAQARQARGPRSYDVGSATFLFKVFWRRKILLLSAILCGLAVGLAYVVLVTPRYTARASLLIDFKRLAPVSQDQDGTGSGGRIDASIVESQATILGSQAVIGRVVQELDLTKDPEFNGTAVLSRAKQWLPHFGSRGNTPGDVELLRDTMQNVLDRTDTRRDGLTYLIEIAFSSSDPGKAAKIANAIAEAYLADQLAARQDAANRAASWMKDRLAELRDQASEAERSVIEFREKNAVMTNDGKSIDDQRLADLNTRMVEAQGRAENFKARLDRINQIVAGKVFDAAINEEFSNSIAQTLRETFLTARARVADLSARYGPQHQAVARAKADAEAARDSLGEELKRLQQSFESEYRIAADNVTLLDDARKKLFEEISNRRKVIVQLSQLESAVSTYKTLYDSYLKRYMDRVQEESYPITEARVISTATVPTSPSSPRLLFAPLLCAALAGFAAAGFALLKDIVDRRFLVSLDVEDELELPSLGYLPLMQRRELPAEVLPEGRAVPRSDPTLWRAIDAPLSEFTETIRHIKIAIDETVDKPTRVVGVTSALPAEGKSTLATNLAAHLARSGAQVMLIDADLRVSGLTHRLASAAKGGLPELLTRQVPIGDLLYKVAGLPMAFLPGATDKGPVAASNELLSSSVMTAFLEAMRKEVDYVILDLPPLKPLIDVRAIAPLVDAFVLSVRWNETSVDTVADILTAVPSVRGKVVGAVLSMVDMHAMRRLEDRAAIQRSRYFENTAS